MNLHDVKIRYIADTFKLCGHSIELTYKTSGVSPRTLKKYLELAGISHKTRVVYPAAVCINTWEVVERQYILGTYKRLEYSQKNTEKALGLTARGLRWKLSRYGVPVFHKLHNLMRRLLLESAKAYPNIHEWFAAEPQMVMAAHVLSAVKDIKKELGW